jgi:hypothetical protein
VDARKFFYARSVNFDDLILDCYRLAKYYGFDPDVFLQKPLSTIQRHMKWTAILLEKQRAKEEEANG